MASGQGSWLLPGLPGLAGLPAIFSSPPHSPAASCVTSMQTASGATEVPVTCFPLESSCLS